MCPRASREKFRANPRRPPANWSGKETIATRLADPRGGANVAVPGHSHLPMILDTLDRHFLYHRFGARHARGFTWLTSFSPQMPDGRYEIDGQDVFALVQSYATVPAAEKKYESHRLYLDIQYVAEGTELIQYAPVATLQPLTDYNVEKDYQLHADPEAASALHLSPGQFALFYPQDGHKPGCIAETAGRIKKVVIKVRL